MLIDDIRTQKEAFLKLGCALLAGLLLFLLMNWGGALVFNAGLRKYYCLTPSRVLFVGHSMTEMGIDKKRMENLLHLPVGKYCMNGAGVADRRVMIRQYLEIVPSPPQIIVYDVSARSFSGGLANNAYALFFPFMTESAAVGEYIRKNATPEEYWLKLLVPLQRYDDTRLGAVMRGYTSNWTNMNYQQIDVPAFNEKLKTGNFWHIEFDPENLRLLDQTLSDLNSQNITVVLAGLPSIDLLNNAEPEKYAKAMAIFKEYSQKYPQVRFIDLNPAFSGDHSIFADPIHLNVKGQKIVTERLAVLLSEILQSPASDPVK